MLTRRIPNAPPVARLRDDVDRLFERYFRSEDPRRTWGAFALRRFPTVNVWQDDDDVFVEAELPGLTRDDLELTVSGHALSIKGERPPLDIEEGSIVHRRERGSGAFHRLVHFPVDVDDEQVEAVFRDGVLTVTLAKVEIAKPRRIPVKAMRPIRQGGTTT